MNKVLRVINFCETSEVFQINKNVFIRCMSQYPKHFIEPIFNKEKQNELENSGELAKITHIPVRAAKVDSTSSVFHDEQVRLFTNYVMRHGKKSLARSLVEKTFENIKRIQLEKYHLASEENKSMIELNPKLIFYKAVDNCKPIVYLTPIKRGGVTYQVPVPVTDKRSQFMSMNWLIEAGKDKERTIRFTTQLARELIDAANNQGKVVKKKQDLHKQCEANRAYAHYRWS